MTLDEAIQHCEEVAKDRNETANSTPTEYGDYINSCRECANEHEQLAEWLKELKALKEKPQGEWIDYDNTFYKCPDCGYLLEKCCPQCQNKVILPKGGAEK